MNNNKNYLKYMKYKTKYLNLIKLSKNQSGGNPLPLELKEHTMEFMNDKDKISFAKTIYANNSDLLKIILEDEYTIAKLLIPPTEPEYSNWLLARKFIITSIKIQNPYELTDFNTNSDLKKQKKFLKNLTFGDFFDKPLEGSLAGLTSLKKLTFGFVFNQNLGTSLAGLTNLTHLTFGDMFNQNLGTSLAGLTNLKHLTFGGTFSKPLSNNSFTDLTGLRSLTFGHEFNQYLEDSLKNLTELESLTFGEEFNLPLGDSLINCTSLKILKFGSEFNQLLNNVLAMLESLKILHISTEYTHEITPREGLTIIRY